ncbi:peptide-N4-asparagine amidase A [Streptomyces cinnamoneus]|uniref:Peptide-N4-asparagine amidase A n=1 Tax=Streptomyces cinnamoneus TaxID=53446 RepID=A0A2G1XN09_STRCJ|nr:peptide-N4-asparagine amidase [Streptomyces cinnamoneus]PHQ52561.1 peptide-N4-asparagine amidase A [Streptomyces cinnamoneus]PPT16099.1 peptide-N4-asparagine amidase A [Streptomyces cinnamoneus]
MRRLFLTLCAAALGLVLGMSPAAAAGPPPEFGTDWHDPVTAGPPVPTPGTTSCKATVADTEFRDYTPYKGTYLPPKGCGDRWNKVVLRLEGAVAGRQYDRLGYLHIGGVEVLRTSTPEPSPEGVAWNVEKDVTRYAATLRSRQPVEMLIGNLVNETYTGVIKVKVTLTFYAAEGSVEPAPAPDRVLTLDGAHTVGAAYEGTLTTPRNSERIVAEVYATGSGGECEEFWYLTVPDAAPYSCKAQDGPYREVRVAVDGKLAGIAAPYPTVWTGGWSNPFLWYVIPGPRAFDVRPVEYDLTPFAGQLNDGKPHTITVSVAGVPEGRSGWSTPTNILVWQDAGADRVTGALTTHREGAPRNTTALEQGAEYRLKADGGHALTVAGYLDTSHGRVGTTVTREVAATSLHRWTKGETTDGLQARWDDDETVTVAGRGPATVTHARRAYSMNGETSISGGRLRTVMTMGDRADSATLRAGAPPRWTRLDDTYTGDASYNQDVPRDQRHATGVSRERYRLQGSGVCYDRTLATAQGELTEDSRRC